MTFDEAWPEIHKAGFEHGWHGIARKAWEMALLSASKPAAKSCQTGWGDICHMAKHDGVTCPDDSCDIDDGVRAAPAQSGEAIYQWRVKSGDNEWQDVPKHYFETIGPSFRRIVYTTPQPPQSAEGGEACGPYECQAAQQDGVLCADDSCDIATGVRTAAVELDDERAALAAALEAGRYTHASSNTEKHRAFKDGWKQAMAFARAASPQPVAQTEKPDASA